MNKSKQISPREEAQVYWQTWQDEWGHDLNSSCSDPDCGYIYFLRSGKFYKIGKTKDPMRRFPQISLKMPFPTRMWAIWWAPKMSLTEQALHMFYEQYHVNGEWFALPIKEAEAIQHNANPITFWWFMVSFRCLKPDQYGDLERVRAAFKYAFGAACHD